MKVKRGDIFYADLSPVVGSEQGGVRPVLVVQNDIGNKYSPTVIIAAITSQMNKVKLPTHVEVSAAPLEAKKGAAKTISLLVKQAGISTLLQRQVAGESSGQSLVALWILNY